MRKKYYLIFLAFLVICVSLVVGLLAYRRLFFRYPQPPPIVSQEPAPTKNEGIPPTMPEKYSDVIAIEGSLFKNDKLQLDTFTVLPGGKVSLPSSGREYSFRELDTKGNVLFESYFDVGFQVCLMFSGKNVEKNCEEVDTFPIGMIVPYPDEAEVFVFKHGDQELSSIKTTGRLPSLDVSYPESGRNLRDTVAVRWEMFDGDSNQLSYSVEYKRNRPSDRTDSPWFLIHKGNHEPGQVALSWDISKLEPGSYSLKVIVSDGSNASWSTVDNLFIPKVRKGFLQTIFQTLLEKFRL